MASDLLEGDAVKSLPISDPERNLGLQKDTYLDGYLHHRDHFMTSHKPWDFYP